MTVRKTHKGYAINTPGFEGVRFTEISDYLQSLSAVRFAAERGAIIHSAREAAAYRIAAPKDSNSLAPQTTRTASVYFNEHNKLYAAFDDIPDANLNIIVAGAQEANDFPKKHFNTRYVFDFILPQRDPRIAALLKRAEKSDRIVEVLENPRGIVAGAILSTRAGKNGSAFGRDKIIQAILGDVAEPYAAMLYKENYKKGCIAIKGPWQMSNLERGLTIISPVYLEGESGRARNEPNAISNCHLFNDIWGDIGNDTGRARGVYNPPEWRK